MVYGLMVVDQATIFNILYTMTIVLTVCYFLGVIFKNLQFIDQIPEIFT